MLKVLFVAVFLRIARLGFDMEFKRYLVFYSGQVKSEHNELDDAIADLEDNYPNGHIKEYNGEIKPITILDINLTEEQTLILNKMLGQLGYRSVNEMTKYTFKVYFQDIDKWNDDNYYIFYENNIAGKFCTYDQIIEALNDKRHASAISIFDSKGNMLEIAKVELKNAR